MISRDVPEYTKHAIAPLFKRLLPSYEEHIKSQSRAGGSQPLGSLEIRDFDWALHPGGKAIIDGAAQVLDLSEDQLQVTREIYRTRGNSSSASVLNVLDRLRSQSKKEHVVATSFGPGLSIEMALLRRCQADDH
jgi:type III polyketide synthase